MKHSFVTMSEVVSEGRVPGELFGSNETEWGGKLYSSCNVTVILKLR